MDRLPQLIIDFHDCNFVNTVKRTLSLLVESKYSGHILVWDSCDTDEIQIASTGNERFHVVQCDRRFLCSEDKGRKVLSELVVDGVILIDDSVEFGPEQTDALITKFQEYDSEAIVCSQGFRIFPHKPFAETKEFWLTRRYVIYHDQEANDRQVHLFRLDGGCCVFPVKPLIKALTPTVPFNKTYNWDNIGDFRTSLIIAKNMATSIWKVQLSLPVQMASIGQNALNFTKEELTELGELYRIMKDLDWPQNSFSPILPEPNTKPRDKSKIWIEGFHGLNMSAEPVHLDFDAARASGASVVRFGAVNDASDLLFIVKEDGTSKTDREHLETVLPRLMEAVREAGESGLKVILTLCDLPGRRFRDSQDDRMWRSAECRQRIADLWGAIAEGLQDYRDIIIGYDIINEPYTPEDIDLSFYSPMSIAFASELQDLYERARNAIRAVDKDTTLIIESSFWASPLTMPFLLPIDDPFVVYSFHFYCPTIYTFRHENDGRYTYPGKVPKWKNDVWEDEWPLWDENQIRKVIEPVVQWQKKHAIHSSRIFVGEFGVSRELTGSNIYLRDLMKIWEDLGWNWCVFSFRDNEWDAMDYELGEDKINQLGRSKTELFKLIADNLS